MQPRLHIWQGQASFCWSDAAGIRSYLWNKSSVVKMVEQLRIMKGNQLRENRQIFCIDNDKKILISMKNKSLETCHVKSGLKERPFWGKKSEIDYEYLYFISLFGLTRREKGCAKSVRREAFARFSYRQFFSLQFSCQARRAKRKRETTNSLIVYELFINNKVNKYHKPCMIAELSFRKKW